ncbi:uncharacterized protein LOC129732728 [Wyeomyia smithii]|uniref:uncharacterized protein LOC129732728 n=1 Tax=Wyeomyia smithii TaxID=174621 RepID=UPI002467C9D1|nr:uncharacterized protein LOC129732728 [Wyeomyia smithii]
MTSQETNGDLECKKVEVESDVKPKIPAWLDEAFFEDIFVDKQQLEQGKFKVKIKALVPTGGAGENYTSLLYRADVDAECEDGTVKNLRLILKAMISNPDLKQFSVFVKEKTAYEQLLPTLEKLWAATGTSVSFGPLAGRRWTEMWRSLCWMICARKATRLRTASLVPIGTMLVSCWLSWRNSMGMVQEEGKPLFEQYIKLVEPVFLKSIEAWPGHEVYQRKMSKALQGLFYKMMEATAKVDTDFVTLCHGDVWTNNHMYHYQGTDEPDDALLIDLQGPYYGSPVCDLYYYLISSTTLDLKTSQFEELIQYYHSCLVDSLQKLDYPERIPSLRDFRIEMLKRGFFATQCLFGILPVVLADKNENANFDGFFGETEENVKFKNDVYNNPLYQLHLKPLLKMFDLWGLLE